MLLLVSQSPAFLMSVLEAASKEDQPFVLTLIEPIVNVLYENLVEGDEFYKDITKMVIDVQEE